MFMIESHPSGRCVVLTSQLQSQVARSQARLCCVMWCDAIRCDLINAKLHFPMPSSQGLPPGRQRHPNLGRYRGT